MEKLPSILDRTREELSAQFAEAGVDPYRAGQALAWVYGRGAKSFDEMTDLSKEFRGRCADRFRIFTSTIEEYISDKQGTARFVVRLADGAAVEGVLMTARNRNVVCLSTQVGCPIGCAFCASGQGGFTRNLSAGEIVEQFLHAKNRLPEGEAVSSVVYMGMGEPFLNTDAVLKSIGMLNADWGAGVGARHITVSTIGIPAGIRKLAKSGRQVTLAVSLHSLRDDVRRRIVVRPPTDVAGLINAAEEYFAATKRRVTFEYVLVAGVNDSEKDARELVEKTGHLRPFVNLIPLNAAGGDFKPPGKLRVSAFRCVLEDAGLAVLVRDSKGSSIAAGCGQLAGKK